MRIRDVFVPSVLAARRIFEIEADVSNAKEGWTDLVIPKEYEGEFLFVPGKPARLFLKSDDDA